MQKYNEAIKYLETASSEMPDHARAFYNLGQLQDFMGKSPEAETALKEACRIEPDNPDFKIALIEFYMKQKNFSTARKLATSYRQQFPEDTSIIQLLDYLDSQLN
jgi:Tfp pilus assembly protein PilF